MKTKFVPLVLAVSLITVSSFFVFAHVYVVTQLDREHHPGLLPNHPFLLIPQAFAESSTLKLDDFASELWYDHEFIIDGTILDITGYDKPERVYDIQINSFFKPTEGVGPKVITVYGSPNFYNVKGERGIFFIKKDDARWTFGEYGTKITGECPPDLMYHNPPLIDPPLTRGMHTTDYSLLVDCYPHYYKKYLPQYMKAHGATEFPSPLAQQRDRVSPNEVVCNEGLELVMKNNGRSSCVKPSTTEKLLERKWAKPIPSMFRDEPNVKDMPPIVTSNAELNQKCATLFDDIIESQQESLVQCELDGNICEPTPLEDVLSQLPISQEFRDNNCSLTLNDWSHLSKNEDLIWSSEINWEKTIHLSNIFLMKPDSSEFFYYPNPEDTENRDAYETFMLIRLPEWLGGNVDDLTAFRAYSALAVDDHCLVKYWPGEGRQQIMNPCSGGFYRSIDGAMIMTFGRIPGGQPIALPHLELSTDENGFLFIEPPVWSKTKNGVIGYGREITSSEIEQGSMFLINSFEKTHPDYPGIPPVFAGMNLADIGQEEDERFKILFSEFTPLAQHMEIYVSKCDCDELRGKSTYEIETIGNTTLAIHGIKSGGDDEYHIWFAKDGFEYEVVGKDLDFIKNSITVKLLQ